MKVAVGISTYNRADLVGLNALYLCRSRLTSDVTLLVVDDASTEYDVAFLREVYPSGTDIQRRDQNSGGADFAIYDLLNRLVSTEAEVLVLLDSDLIVSGDFMVKTIELLPLAKGILSLFNTPAHAAVGSRGPFLLKKTVGSAGTVWPRRVAVETLAGVPPGRSWDWRFSDFLIEAGYEICVVRGSFVQHMCFNVGQNSGPLTGDFGSGFSDVDVELAYRSIEQLAFGAMSAVELLRARSVTLERVLRQGQQGPQFAAQHLREQAATINHRLAAAALRRMSASEEVVRQRAHDLWDHAGRLHGRSDEFWFAAKAEFQRALTALAGSLKNAGGFYFAPLPAAVDGSKARIESVAIDETAEDGPLLKLTGGDPLAPRAASPEASPCASPTPLSAKRASIRSGCGCWPGRRKTRQPVWRSPIRPTRSETQAGNGATSG